MINVEGNLTIDTYNDKPVAVISQINAPRTSTNIFYTDSQPENGQDSNKAENNSNIRFTGKRGQKIDLYRVIIALYECGFFTDASGAKPSQKQVFEAFGQMLGADFSDFQKNLSESKNFNNDSEAPTRIFDNLKDAIKQYYDI